MEDLLGLGLADAVPLPITVHAAFGVLCAVLLVRVLDATGKGDQNLHIIVVICLQIGLDLVVVAHRRQPGGGDHHHFTLSADLVLGDVPESLHNDGGLLLQVVGV